MVPKIIHYCWFGTKTPPILMLKCIESWKYYFPNWEIKLWNENNSPMHLPYMENAYKNQKWSNLSNYTRLFALKNEGGIYFDTDVEVIKPFDFLDKYDCFVGIESEPHNLPVSVNNAVLASTPNHPFIIDCLNEIEANYDGAELANLSSPVVTTNVLVKNGLEKYGEQDIAGVHVFGMKAFYPYRWNDVFTYKCVTSETYAIHFWELSWKDKESEVKKLLSTTKSLEQQNTFLKNLLKNYVEGKISIKELLKINIRYFFSFFKK